MQILNKKIFSKGEKQLNTTIIELKEESAERLKMMHLQPKLIKEFVESNILYVSNIKGNLERANQEQLTLVKEIEKKKLVKIYHIIHYKTQNKDILYFLYVDDKINNWKEEKRYLLLGYANSICYKKCIELQEVSLKINQGEIKNVI